MGFQVSFTPAGSTVPPGFIGDITTAGLTSGLKLVLDSGDSNSYSGSGQDWVDTSGAGNADEFHQGATSGSEASDPTFNGSAGGLSSSEFWSFDGGDYFTYGAANETWMENIHKNNAQFSILVWSFHADQTSSKVFIGNNAGPGTGFRYFYDDFFNAQRFSVDDGGTFASGDGATAMTDSAWHFHGISFDETVGAGGGFLFLDGAFNQISGSDTFNATYTTPSAGAAEHIVQIGANGNALNRFGSGDRIAGMFIWEGVVLTKANMDTLWNATKGRFGL